jgi:hypothetical protein
MAGLDAEAYRSLGSIERGIADLGKRLDSHAGERRELVAKVDAHILDNEAHGLKAVRQATGEGISKVNLLVSVVLMIFAFVELYTHAREPLRNAVHSAAHTRTP